MRHGNRWRVLTCIAITAAAIVFGACDDGSDLPGQDATKQVLPPSGYSHPSGDAGVPAAVQQAYDDFQAGKPGPVKPTITRLGEMGGQRPQPGPVELVQSRLDLNPAMGPCPNFGAAAGPGWTQVFRDASPNSNAYPNGQPNNCKQLPPQSNYPTLWHWAYPSGANMNDNIRAFFVWVNPLQCVRVTFTEHDWGGNQLTYQVCAPSTGPAVVFSGNVQADAGFNFGATQAKVEWWAI